MKKLLLFIVFMTGYLSNAQCWKTVASGSNFTLAIKNDGTLWATGMNTRAQLGLGDKIDRTTFEQVGTGKNWSKIDAGSLISMGLKSDGSLWIWGNQGNITIPIQIPGLDWKDISCGKNHYMAIKTDNTLWTWGNDDRGQIGDGGTLNSVPSPLQFGTSKDWYKIAAGDQVSFAIKQNGSLWSCGDNSNSQLGYVTSSSTVRVFTQVGTDEDWESVSSGLSHTLAIKKDRTLWSWGSNIAGACGIGTTNQVNAPTKVGDDTTWGSINAGYSHSLATKTDGSLWAFGFNGLQGLLGTGTTSPSTIPIQIGSQNNWANVSGKNHSVGINQNSEMWVWGSNDFGRFGNGTTTNSTIPINVACASLDTQAFSKSEFRIYPNPSSSLINVSFENNLEKANLKIISILGQTVLEKQNISGNNLSLDVSGLSNGTYVVQVKDGSSIGTSKFTKQ
jgi:alpha-tubulin suppressor-like RCC1 family protein